MTDTAPNACCHDKYQWYDENQPFCQGCGTYKIAWLNQSLNATILLERAVRQAESDRIGVQILGEAADVIDGDRQQNYGDAATNLTRIAALWTTILGHPVDAHQVALCMTALKLARLIETPGHRDSYIDGAGYLALAAELTLTEDS